MRYADPLTYYRWFRQHQHTIPKKIPDNPADFYDFMFGRTLDRQVQRVRYEREQVASEGVFSAQMMSETVWYANHCPYYKIHPGVLPAFLKMRLDVPIRLMPIPCHPAWMPGLGGEPLRCFVLRFVEPCEPLRVDESHCVRTIMVYLMDRLHYVQMQGQYNWTLPELPYEYDYRMTLWLDFGESETSTVLKGDFPIWTFRSLLWAKEDEANAEEAMQRLPVSPEMEEGVQIGRAVIDKCVRMAVSACYLSNSGSMLIRPDVVKADKDKPLTEDLHHAAWQQGKYGWEIGYDDLFRPAPTRSEPTGKGLRWSHIRNLHWHVVRYGPQKSLSRVDLYMQTVVRPDLPMRPSE